MVERLTRCPVCRARMDPDAPLADPCRRCGEDLSSVRLAEREAERLRALAEAHLLQDRPQAALQAAQRALMLVDDAATRATLERVEAAPQAGQR